MNLPKYVTGRLLHSIFLLVGVSILTFIFLELAPGDYFGQMELDPRISPDTVEALRSRYGLDKPLPLRYLHWLGSVLRGEFGFSFAYNVPASSLLWSRAGRTLLLSGIAMLVAWVLAVPWGIWSAASFSHWGRPWKSHMTTTVTSGLLAVPDILLALLLLLIAVRSQWFPTGGMTSVNFDELSLVGKTKDLAAHLFIPVLALTLVLLPVLIRHTQAAMREVLSSSYMQAARSHGIVRRRLFYRHALPAAANPLISLLGFSIASLLSASLLIEVIFGWPGLGPLLLESILARDLYIVIGAVMLSTLLLVTGNLVADLLLFLFDPRIRLEGRGMDR